jgi:hypothetical protein
MNSPRMLRPNSILPFVQRTSGKSCYTNQTWPSGARNFLARD